MHEPPESAPQPPAFPPYPPGGAPPRSGYPSAPGQPVHGPPPAARAFRTRLWVTLGLVGALLLGGGGYVLSSATGDGKPLPSAAGDSKPLSHGGGKPLFQLHLPDTFLGLPRDDDNDAVQFMKQVYQDVTQEPDTHSTITGYTGGGFGENFVFVEAFEQDSATSEQDRNEVLEAAWTPVDDPGLSSSYGPVSDSDPGSLGGTLQCAQMFVKTDTADVFGRTLSGGVRCLWIDTNTLVMVTFSEGVSGQSVVTGADITRRFRAVAESRR